ncbi:MAG: DUF883 family protein [Vicinamibacteria bacterium]
MSYETSSEQLRSPFKSALADAEELVRATAHMGDEKISRLRAKAEESLRTAKSTMTEAQDSIRLRAMYATDAIENRVTEKPWESIGVVAVCALGIGFLAGILVSRD